jgi:hypothetical protein
MKLLLENWRNYSMLHERVNTLDSGKRFIGNILQEITIEYGTPKISPEELEKIKKWGQLDGEPDFLGSGSRGIAYKFGNKVLKITEDTQEAMACAIIAGSYHPNVYDVYLVGRRLPEEQKRNLSNMPYIIIYEFLDYPTKAMADVTNIMYYKIRKNDIYYNWKKSYYEETMFLIKDFIDNIKQDNSLLGEPVRKRQSHEPKIDEMATTFGWSKTQHWLFKEFWTVIGSKSFGGMYGSSFSSVENAIQHADMISKDIKLKYFNQLALGLTFLKQSGITFDDLKTTNVMEKDGQVAIIDIGNSNVSKYQDIHLI